MFLQRTRAWGRWAVNGGKGGGADLMEEVKVEGVDIEG